MKLSFDVELARRYSSSSQKIRVLSEGWLEANQYCPACGYARIRRYTNNRPVADFLCESCGEQFELKSKRGRLGRKVADGTYRTMIERMESSANPNFIFLSYNRLSLTVTDLELVPKHYFSPLVIERRTPLAKHARRAGWEGCNILMGALPGSGRIPLISNGNTVAQRDVLQAWHSSIFLRNETDAAARTWLLAVMMCVERTNLTTFTLQEVYASENTLATYFPENRHVRAKIRQQLQVLRDRGYLKFLGNGVYERNTGRLTLNNTLHR